MKRLLTLAVQFVAALLIVAAVYCFREASDHRGVAAMHEESASRSRDSLKQAHDAFNRKYFTESAEQAEAWAENERQKAQQFTLGAALALPLGIAGVVVPILWRRKSSASRAVPQASGLPA